MKSALLTTQSVFDVTDIYRRIGSYLTAQGISRTKVLQAVGEFARRDQLRSGLTALGCKLDDAEVFSIFTDFGLSRNGAL